MKRRGFLLMLRMALSCAALFMVMAAVTPAVAQIPWNPPCANVKIFNKTDCTFNFTLVAISTGVIPTVNLTPGATVTFAVPFGTRLVGVISAFGNQYNFLPVASPPAFAPWKVTAVTMGPPDCCVDVYADPSTCTVTIFPSAGPFPCND